MKKAFAKRSILAILSLCFAVSCAVLCVYITKEKQLNQMQREALETLKEDIGTYDEKTIVLNHTNKTTAEELAEKLGAKLRITSDGGYATLTLQNGETVHDVYSKKENRALLEKFALDYYSKTSEISATDDLIEKTFMTSTPNYAVSDALYGNQTYINYLNVGDTWNYYRGSGVTVAVIDTGIDTDHAEFVGRISEYSYNATEDKIVKDYATEDGGYDWSLIEDEQGHGTAVSGVIAAGMNDAGIAGIAPEVTLLIIKAECDENGNFYRTSDLVFGLYYAVERDADVVNMSFGTYSPNPFEKATKLAVDSDILCVAAAGNDATAGLCYPAADENVIGVGALEENGTELAFYSNFGENVDIVAPGTTYTTKKGGEYGASTGTSLASPVVAGAMALLKNQNKYLEYADAIELLYASAYDLGGKGEDWYFGYGLIDLSALLVEERGKVTFDMLTDEIDGFEQIFIRNHTLQNIPEPTRTYAVFDGWYYDIHCTEELNLCDDVWTSDLTLYANWVNEDDGVPYTYVTLSDGTIEIRSYTGKRRYITIPEKIDGKIVSSVGDFAFDGQSRLRQVNLPDGLTNIGRSAFRRCNNLLEMRLPDGVKTIGEFAFEDNIRLHSIGMNENIALENIGNFAFAGSGLTRFNVTENVKSLNGSAFYGATSLKNFTVSQENENFTASSGVLFNKTKSKIVAFPAGVSASYALPESVTEIGDYAFGYAGFQNIDLNNVQSIGSYAFANSALESVVIPDTVIFMGKSAFLSNFYLKSLVIGNGLTKISNQAFTGAVKLKEVYIPEKIQGIEAGAFTGSGIEKITFAENSALLKIGADAFASTLLEEITLPKSLIAIGNRAFYTVFALSGVEFEENSALQIIGNEAFGATKSLQTIDLPNGLLQIGEYAFIDSGLSGEVAIPASVNKLGAGAFASCRNLTAIKVAAANETYLDENGVVYNADKTTLVEYPAGNTATDYTLLTTTEVIYDSAFYGSGNLDFIYLPQSLTNIERYAFYDVSNLQNIDIPENVVQISNYAFAYDGKLRSINFTENSKLPRISYAAFAYSGIYSMRIPSNVSTVAQYAFEQCDNLQSVTFAANSKLDVAPAYMFEGANNLVNITFENGSALTAISAHGFERMNKLKTVDFGDAKIVRIDNYAFRYCENLQTIELPDTLKEIGRFAFYGNKALARIDLPENVERIGRYAFYGTENFNVYFKSETLPANLQENWDAGIVGYYVGVTDVVENGDWKYATLADGCISIIKYTGSDTILDLTTLDLGGGIKQIGGYAFYRSPIESIILPQTLTQIQRYAFADSALKSVTIPANVEFIGQYAFYHTALETAEFATDSTLKKIERYAFSYNRSLGKITLPASVSELGTYAFYGSAITELNFEANSALTTLPAHAFASTKLISVVLPDGVNYIADNAFRDCVNLQSVTFGVAEHLQVRANAFYNTAISSLELPANLEYIGEYAFIGLENLTEYKADENNPNYRTTDGVLYSKDGKKLIAFPAGKTGNFTVPKTVETIGYGAFENTKLASVEFEEGINLLTMGYRAFYNARNLSSVSVPASVVSIDFYAFAECRNLEKVTFANESKLTGIYEGAFLNCVKLSEIVIPDSIVEISDFAFYGCLSLKQLPVSDNSALKGIYDYAFAYTGLKELNVPESVTDIGAYAFRGARLTKITIPDTQMYNLLIGIGAFQDCNNLTEIALPFIGARFDDSNTAWFSYIFGAGTANASYMYVPNGLSKISITISGEKSTEQIFGRTYVNDSDRSYLENLEELILPCNLETISDFSFYKCTKLKSVIFPDSLLQIGSMAFYACDGLARIELPIKLVDIRNGAFSYSGLFSITLPSSVKTIENDAFLGCVKLFEVINNSDLPICLGQDTYGGIAQNAEVVIQKDGGKQLKDGEEKVYVETPEHFRFLKENENYTLIAYTGSKKEIELPKNINGHPYSIKNFSCSAEKILIPETFSKIDDQAFCFSTVKEISLSDGITAIGKNAFENSSICRIKLADSINVIEESAFENCRNLEFVVLPENLIEIGTASFSTCLQLKQVVFNQNLISIGKNVFFSCASLEELRLPKSVKTIGANAFADCTNLKNVNFNKGLYKIGISAFYGTAIESLEIPDTVAEVGSSAFGSCSSLKTVKFSEKVKNINDFTFSNCFALDSIVFPEQLEFIGDSAFWNCISLKNVTVPKNVKKLSGHVFEYCTNLEKVIFQSDQLMTISRSAFSGCKNLKTVRLPQNIKTIENSAFNQCAALEDFEIPETVELIEGNALNDCTVSNLHIGEKLVLEQYAIQAFDNVIINPNNKEYLMENGVLYNISKSIIIGVSSSVKDLKIPASVKELSALNGNKTIESVEFQAGFNKDNLNGVFSGCFALKKVVLPECVTSIVGTFADCKSLKNVTLPSTLQSISPSAFSGCNELETILLSQTLQTIGTNAFENCISLKYVVLPDSVTTISDLAFKGCAQLLNIDLPNNLQKIGDGAFSGCSALTNVELPESLMAVGEYTFSECPLREMNIPSNISTLPAGIFANCLLLESITIPEGVTEIEYWALYNCENIKAIKLPSTLLCIDRQAFEGCVRLRKIVNLSDVELKAETHDRSLKYVCELENKDGKITKLASCIDRIITDDGFVIDHYYFDQTDEYVLLDYLGKETNVIVPQGITEIGNGAFQNCEFTENIVLPDSVSKIYAEGFYGTAFYKNEKNWENGALYIGNNLIKVKKDVKELVLKPGTKVIAISAFEDCYQLTDLTVSGDYFAAFQELSNLETIRLEKLPSRIRDYFGVVPITLKNVIIKEGCKITTETENLFDGISGVTVFVEDEKIDCAWNEDCPRWNCNNKVLWGKQWINVKFYNHNQEVIQNEYISVSRIVRRPSVENFTEGVFVYTFLGWDMNNDGQVDMIPATASSNITAKAIFSKEFICVQTGHSGGFATCLKKAVCRYCGEEYGSILGHKASSAVEENRIEATCTEDGHYESVVYCLVCEEEVSREEKTISSLGHKASSAVEENRVNATCTEDGYYEIVVYCLVCEEELSREKKTISALGHDYLHHEGKATTCTETGWKEYDTCTRCDYSTYEKLAAKGHTEIIDRAVAATCTKTGLTEGKHCSECSAILVAQRTTEALGHDYGEWTTIEKPTETDKGTEERVCKRCDHWDQRSVPELKDVAAFKAAVSDLSGKKNEALFTAIKTAVELYNSLSDENRELVEKEYAELKSAIATYNEIVSAQNEAFAEANETALGLLVARLTVLAAMIYLLKRKLL